MSLKPLYPALLALLLCAPAMAQAQDKSFTPSAVLTVDALDNSAGGIRTGGHVISDLDLGARWQGADGWSAGADILIDGGGGFSANYSGDFQGVSNNDGPPGTRLFQAYVARQSGPVALSAGLMDLNAHFDVQTPGGDFINLSRHMGADMAQAGVSISPISALGAIGEWQVAKDWTVRAAVFDAVPGEPGHTDAFIGVHLASDEGAFLIAEGEHDVGGGYVKLGHWADTVATPRLDGTGVGRRSGTYAHVGVPLNDHLSVLARLGTADGHLMPVDRSAELTLVRDHIFPGRDSDSAGLSVSEAHFGGDYRRAAGDTAPYERNYEAYVMLAVTPNLNLQPDVQVILHPSGRRDIKTAVVLGLRLIASFGG